MIRQSGHHSNTQNNNNSNNNNNDTIRNIPSVSPSSRPPRSGSTRAVLFPRRQSRHSPAATTSPSSTTASSSSSSSCRQTILHRRLLSPVLRPHLRHVVSSPPNSRSPNARTIRAPPSRAGLTYSRRNIPQSSRTLVRIRHSAPRPPPSPSAPLLTSVSRPSMSGNSSPRLAAEAPTQPDAAIALAATTNSGGDDTPITTTTTSTNHVVSFTKEKGTPAQDSISEVRARAKLAQKQNDAMVYLDGPQVYTCGQCRTHLTSHDDIISKSFHGRHGRAYLFDQCVNVTIGPPEDRFLITGMHTVCDIFCKRCKHMVGWTYAKAFDVSQKYKEGKFIIEKINLHLEESDYYDVSHPAGERRDRFRVRSMSWGSENNTSVASLPLPSPSRGIGNRASFINGSSSSSLGADIIYEYRPTDIASKSPRVGLTRARSVGSTNLRDSPMARATTRTVSERNLLPLPPSL